MPHGLFMLDFPFKPFDISVMKNININDFLYIYIYIYIYRERERERERDRETMCGYIIMICEYWFSFLQ